MRISDWSSDVCSSDLKKGDLAVNVSGRLPGGWLPAPMKIGAFDQPEADPEDFDTDMDGDGIEDDDMERGEFADDELACTDPGAGDDRPPSLCLSSAPAASPTATPRLAVPPASPEERWVGKKGVS